MNSEILKIMFFLLQEPDYEFGDPENHVFVLQESDYEFGNPENEIIDLTANNKQLSFETFPIARKTFPFLSWFEDIVVSGEVNMVKPDRDIYEYAIKRFELADTSSAVFIDDRLENIETAQSLGLHGIHFKHPAQFAEELLALGIE